MGPNQQSEFFADPGLASPPIEIDNHPTATHESADVMEQVSLSDLVEAQNKKQAHKNERRPSKKRPSLQNLLQPPLPKNQNRLSSASEAENENHSCEDEELVMKDDNDSHNKPNDEPFKNTDKNYYQSLTHAVKAEDTLEDPTLNGYSSLENGEVRDEDELEEDEEEVEAKRNSL